MLHLYDIVLNTLYLVIIFIIFFFISYFHLYNNKQGRTRERDISGVRIIIHNDNITRKKRIVFVELSKKGREKY